MYVHLMVLYTQQTTTYDFTCSVPVNSRVQLAQFMCSCTWIHWILRTNVLCRHVFTVKSRVCHMMTRTSETVTVLTQDDSCLTHSKLVTTGRTHVLIHVNTHENTFWWSGTNYEPMTHTNWFRNVHTLPQSLCVFGDVQLRSENLRTRCNLIANLPSKDSHGCLQLIKSAVIFHLLLLLTGIFAATNCNNWLIVFVLKWRISYVDGVCWLLVTQHGLETWLPYITMLKLNTQW